MKMFLWDVVEGVYKKVQLSAGIYKNSNLWYNYL